MPSAQYFYGLQTTTNCNPPPPDDCRGSTLTLKYEGWSFETHPRRAYELITDEY